MIIIKFENTTDVWLHQIRTQYKKDVSDSCRSTVSYIRFIEQFKGVDSLYYNIRDKL